MSSHTNISLFFIENKPLTANHPFSLMYNGAGMILLSVQPSASPAAPPPPLWVDKSKFTERTHFSSQPEHNKTTCTSRSEAASPGSPLSAAFPPLAHSRRRLVSSWTTSPAPCNLLFSAGKKNFTGWH